MPGVTMEKLSKLPEEMLQFNILQGGASNPGPRVGQLLHHAHEPINTPHFLGYSSRGVIPHITHDTFKKHTSIPGIYTALEDYVEKGPQKTPPIFKVKDPDGHALRKFIALEQNALLVLGARRISPIVSPNANTNDSIGMFTSVGFRSHNVADFTSVAQKLRPDIVIALGDVPYGNDKPSQKRREKMVDRTAKWVAGIVYGRMGLNKTAKSIQYNVFAPILPIPLEQQTWYTERLLDDNKDALSGLAMYDADAVPALPVELKALPRLSMDNPKSPNRILYEISLGMDIFIIPFIGDATDAGIALDIDFPIPAGSNISDRKPLGIDMWQKSHALDLSPLKKDCTCYACSKHHRAYLQHLLSAKEMLAWVLLQIHNYKVMDDFFQGIRTSISEDTFEADRQAFEAAYESELPPQTGAGPRMRGYQYKADGPLAPKRNEPAYRMLDDGREKLLEASSAATPKGSAEELQEDGFAEVPKDS